MCSTWIIRQKEEGILAMEKSRNKGMDLEYIKGMNLLRNSVSTINKYD